jgi:L-amino acid N-acyltransferase YncA
MRGVPRGAIPGFMSAGAVISVAPMRPADWDRVREIYLDGIATGNATFEASAPDWAHWDAGHLSTCRLIARIADGIAGWAALSPVSGRCVYAGVAEVSVYVAAEARGLGIGKALLSELVNSSEREGIWTLQAGIFAENTASIQLHERCGFRVVGVREKLGAMNGRWRDVVLLERRSATVGY